MRKISISLMIVALLFVAVSSYAGSLTLNGTVRDGTGQVVPGVKVTWRMSEGDKVVYTNSFGKYTLPYKNFCNYRTVTISKTGYLTQFKQLRDGSCCSCDPNCSPLWGEWGCAKSLTFNFILIKNPFVKSLAERPEIATAENRKEIIQTLLGIWVATYCNRNICDYDCLYQGVADFFNGNEFMFGHRTRTNIELPECPDVLTFVDFVNNWLDAMWEYYYGDNFPNE